MQFTRQYAPDLGKTLGSRFKCLFFWLNLKAKNSVTALHIPLWKASFQSQVIFESYVFSESGAPGITT